MINNQICRLEANDTEYILSYCFQKEMSEWDSTNWDLDVTLMTQIAMQTYRVVGQS